MPAVYVIYSAERTGRRVRRTVHYVGKTTGSVDARLASHLRTGVRLPGDLVVSASVGSLGLLGPVEYFLWLNLGRPGRNRAAPALPRPFQWERHRAARKWARRKLNDPLFGWVVQRALNTPSEIMLRTTR